MKVSGFTVIRNAELMGYPVIPSIKSILPIVDEFVIGVGQSDDNTKALIEGIGDPKIKVFDSFWDTSKTKGGLILSEKTNEALDHCSNDWCFYLQADEVIHEQDLARIHSAMEKYENDDSIQGLLFHYTHFYGSYSVVAQSRKWYRNEIRVIKKSSGARSHGDAQGFRIPPDNQKLKVAHCRAQVYHYGWVKPPQKMGQKKKLLDRWWHGNKKDNENDQFDFDRQYGLREFKGSHPAIMKELIAQQDWKFDYHRSIRDMTLKDLNLMASDLFETIFNYRIGEYKPYQLIK